MACRCNLHVCTRTITDANCFYKNDRLITLSRSDLIYFLANCYLFTVLVVIFFFFWLQMHELVDSVGAAATGIAVVLNELLHYKQVKSEA